MEKYFNDAIIGNKKITASYSKTGELLRFFYPTKDYKQFVDFFHTGLKVNDSGLIYLHNDVNNIYNQYYTEDTNILNTEIMNSYFKLKILQTDFVCIDENILVKKYKFINENIIDLDLDLVFHSCLTTNHNNQVSGYSKSNILFQYTHDYTFCIFSKNKILSSQINNTSQNIEEGQIYDKDYVGMSADSSISYKLRNYKTKRKSRNRIIYLHKRK